MSTEAFHGFGSLFKIGSGVSPETFTAVLGVTKIKLPGFTVSEIDVTDLTQLNAFKKAIPGMKTGTKIGIVAKLIPGTATQSTTGRGVGKLANDRTTFNSQIVLSDEDETEVDCTGWINSYDPGEVANDQAPDLSFEITLTEQAGQL